MKDATKRAVPLAILSATALLSPPASAADLPDSNTQIFPCRPTIACTADISAPGTLELEAGALYRHVAAPRPEWTFPFLFKLSLAPWMQVQLGSNGFTTGQDPGVASYLDNLDVVAKLHFQDADAHGLAPSLAASAALSVPTVRGQEGYSSAYDAFLVAYASKDIGPIHADGNVGLNLWNLDTTVTPQEFATLALSMSLPSPFGIMAEAYYFSDQAPVVTHDGGLLVAVSHSPRPWLTFDVGGDIGFFPSARALSTFVGLTVAPAVLWR
jgi:hypothetical protein